MRYEAKHQYFNQLAKTMGNYLNLCHSLAMRHHCLQAYVLTSGSIVRERVEVGKIPANIPFLDTFLNSVFFLFFFFH